MSRLLVTTTLKSKKKKVKIQQNSFNSLVINYYTYTQYLDLNLGITTYLYCSKYLVGNKYYLVGNKYYIRGIKYYSYHEYKTFLYSLVFHAPKPIKLGSKGSSTKLWWTVNNFKNSKIKKTLKNSKISWNLIFLKNIAKFSALALEKGPDKQNYFWPNFGQENLTFFEKKNSIFSEKSNAQNTAQINAATSRSKVRSIKALFEQFWLKKRDPSWDNYASSTKNNSLTHHSST
jgi:hypothetical protein